jgi:hypothetical protein
MSLSVNAPLHVLVYDTRGVKLLQNHPCSLYSTDSIDGYGSTGTGWVCKELGMQFHVRPLDTQTFPPGTIDFFVVQNQTIVLERVEIITRQHLREGSIRSLFGACTGW